MDEERKFDDVSISEHIIELQERVTNLEILCGRLSDFVKLQSDINEILKYLVVNKYEKNELTSALNGFSLHKSEEKPHKSEEETVEKSGGNIVENDKK